MFGKISVGVRRMATGPNISSKIHIQGALEPLGNALNTRPASLSITEAHFYRKRLGKTNLNQPNWHSFSPRRRTLNRAPLRSISRTHTTLEPELSSRTTRCLVRNFLAGQGLRI